MLFLLPTCIVSVGLKWFAPKVTRIIILVRNANRCCFPCPFSMLRISISPVLVRAVQLGTAPHLRYSRWVVFSPSNPRFNPASHFFILYKYYTWIFEACQGFSQAKPQIFLVIKSEDVFILCSNRV